jgi:DNA-binding MarR family transcriptional regulator
VDPLAGDLYALVVFLHKNCNADLFAAVGELDLSLTQVKMLHYLEDAERDLTVKDLAELVPVSLPAASRSVDELFRRGLVDRNEDTEDRRMKRVHVTDAGLAVTVRLNSARLSGLEQLTATLPSGDRDALTRALAVLMTREDIAACRPTGVTP